MENYPEKSLSSARSVLVRQENLEKEALKRKNATNLKTKLAIDQIALLREANDFAKLANVNAQESKAESQKSLRIAIWANVIAAISMFFAAASFVYNIWMPT